MTKESTAAAEDQDLIGLEEELETLLAEMDDEESSDEKPVKKEKAKSAEDEEDLEDEELEDEDEDEALDEEYKAKAQKIFETAVDMKVSSIKEELEAEMDSRVEAITEDLESRVDEYAQYVVTEWYNENEFKVNSSLKTEIAENFISGLKDLFDENYFDVPADKNDLCESLGQTVTRLKTESENLIEELELANFEILETKKASIVESVGSDLFDNQKAKLMKLAESITASDVEDFESKLASIKDVFFAEAVEETTKTNLDQGIGFIAEEYETSVGGYASFLSKSKKF